MEQRACGRSGFELSALGAGCWAYGGGEYWGAQNQKDVDSVVHAAVDVGITYFDTAEAYNDGRSEESLGAALSDIPRDKVIVGTKISPAHAYPDLVEKHCDASLKRLGIEYVDLYMIHWPINPHSIRHFTRDEWRIAHPPALAEAVEALEALRKKGKVRYLGVSNFGKQGMEEIAAHSLDISVNQLPCNLLCRALEYEALPYCRTEGIGVIGYMTLLQGILADIYKTLRDVPPWQRRTRHFDAGGNALARHGERGLEAQTDAALAEIRRIARHHGMGMPEIALKWALAAEGMTCCLVGARTVAELRENAASAAVPLSPSIVMELNAATTPLKEKMGLSMDFYESRENDRTSVRHTPSGAGH